MPINNVAFFIFPRLTALDLIGVYDALRRLPGLGIAPDLRWRIIGSQTDCPDDGGLILRADGVYESLDPFDLLVVPGGLGTRVLAHDSRCIDWLRSWGNTRPIASVC